MDDPWVPAGVRQTNHHLEMQTLEPAKPTTWLAEKALDCCLHPVKTTSLWRQGREKNENRQKFWMPDFSPLLPLAPFRLRAHCPPDS